MNRWIPSLALVLALIAVGTVRSSDARVSANIDVRIGAPAPFVVYDREPAVVLVPGTQVYYAEDLPYDMYRYGSSWYVCDDDVWYRARRARGPFVSIAFEDVPRSVLTCAPRVGRDRGRPWSDMIRRGDGGYGRYDVYGGRTWDRDRGVYRGDYDRDRGWNGDREWRSRGDWNRDRGRGRDQGGDRGHGRHDRGDDDDDD